ncbi:hypothetical protein VB10N_20330 [Vibrio sp. 10N]|nr:hypothetical protein VB10N_20330 [Vibrio sp. 10N]
MKSSKSDHDDDFFNVHLPEPNDSDVRKAVNEYTEAINTAFHRYHQNSENLLYSDSLSIKSNESQSKLKETLSLSNYEPSALLGEHVIIFDEPMLVAELKLGDLLASDSAKIVRLISYGSTEKKVANKIISRDVLGNAKSSMTTSITTFEIYDFVSGLILPNNCHFKSLTALPIRSIVKDQDFIIKIQGAYLKLRNSGSEATLAWQSTIVQARDLIREGSARYNSLQVEISSLDRQKESIETRLLSLNESMDSATKLQNEIQDSIEVGNKKVQELEESHQKLSGLLTRDRQDHSFVQEQLKDDKKELNSIRSELSEARKNKSLSNYESIAHTNEAKIQLVGYYFVATLVLVALCGFVNHLYQNAITLENLLTKLVLLDASPWDILLSRLPLMTATALTIGALSATLFFLIKQIVSINNEKMTMLKAGILARQISDSLDLGQKSDDEIIKLQRDIKIKLITEVFDSKHHVSNTLNNNIVKDITELFKSTHGK